MRPWRSLWSWLTRVPPTFWPAATALAVGSALVIWLPRATTDTTSIHLAEAAAPLVLVPFWIAGLWRWRSSTNTDGAGVAGFRPLLLLCASLSLAAVSAGLSTYATHPLGALAPAPGLAEMVRLGAEGVLLLCILALPMHAPAPLARLRLLIEGLLATIAVFTFCWLWLAPPLLHGLRVAREATLAVAAMPLGDALIGACLVVLLFRDGALPLRPALATLLGGLGVLLLGDGAFAGEWLSGTYQTGTVLSAVVPAGLLIAGLGAYNAMVGLWARPTAEGAASPSPAPVPRVWRSLLPYVLVLATAAFLAYAWQASYATDLKAGVYAGGALLIWLVLSHQAVVILEARRLYRVINDSYGQLVASARQTHALVEELRSTQDALRANNHALSEANSHLQDLWEQATVDPLTGLLNHRAVEIALRRELERSRRYGRVCAMMFLDLDHFKRLNDTYGHLSGNVALRELSAVFKAALRSTDIVGRWGGEELVAILPEAEVAAAHAAAEHVRAAVANRIFSVGEGVHLTCSIGVAVYPYDAADSEALVEAADRAMYVAKRAGRNQVRLASDPEAQALEHKAEALGRDDGSSAGAAEALATLAEARDLHTMQHDLDVSFLAERLAQALGLGAHAAQMVGMAGRLHDIGKVVVPEAVLRKAGALTEGEWALIRMHPAVGADVVEKVPALRALAPMIRGHHERWDGRGYPDGLLGDQIPLGGRIVAVADAYVTMTAGRPYRQAFHASWALEELRRGSGSQFDPAVVLAMERVLDLASDGAPAARLVAGR